MKTILVPVDFSGSTARVCAAAQAFAQLSNSRLLLLHVVQPPAPVYYDFNAFDAGQLAGAQEAGEKYSDRQLAALARRWQKPGKPVRTARITGQAARAIAKYAVTAKAAYIVMGSHGHGAVYDLFVGSTTQGVLKQASCPVLVIPISAVKPGKR